MNTVKLTSFSEMTNLSDKTPSMPMLTDLLKKSIRGLKKYQRLYPDIYAGYEKDIAYITHSMNNLRTSIEFLQLETPQPDDPMPARKEEPAS
jgi:hypothetical protein